MFGVNPTGQSLVKRTSGINKPGADGREIELQTTSSHIQWRYRGSLRWIDLIMLRDLQGDKGNTGKPGEKGADGKQGIQGIQGEKGDVGPRGLPGEMGNPGLDGLDGKNGKDGRQIELRVFDGYIEWRYVGNKLWKKLIALEELRGPQGKVGQKGEKGDKGERGITGYAGSQGMRGPQGFTGPAGPQGPPGSSVLAVRTETDNYTATADDNLILMNNTTPKTVTMPTAVGNTGIVITVKKISTQITAPVTVDGAGSETIDDLASITIPLKNNSATMVSDGANWRMI